MDSEFKKENIKISIAVQDKDLYTICSEDRDGKYEVERKFRDLLLLRKFLTRQWPGCYVPYIPKSVSSFDETDLRKLVENYLIKLISIIFLYKSRAFQLFIKDPKDFNKQTLDQESIIQISERYRSTFSHVSLTELQDSYIQESIEYFSNILNTLESCYNSSILNTNNYQNFAISLNSTLDTLNKTGKSLTDRESTVKLREECINPYGIIKDWILSEIFDIKGILHAIKSREKIARVVKKLKEAEESQLAVFEKVNSGKVGIFNKLVRKGEEEVKETANQNLMQARHELELARLTEKIIDCRLSKLELPFFRKNKKHQFNTVFKAFIKANLEEYESMMEQAKNMIYIQSNK